MTLEEAYSLKKKECRELERKNKALSEKVKSYEKGTYESSERAEHLKTINKLTREKAHLTKEVERYKRYWRQQIEQNNITRAETYDVAVDYDSVVAERDQYKEKCAELEKRLETILGTSSQKESEYKKRIEALTDALQREKAKADNDGTNSSIPTSQTPIDKEKVIPNSRVSSGKKRGAQPGHAKHSMNTLPEVEITASEDHTLLECSVCGSKHLECIGNRPKDVIDYQVKLIKKRHNYYEYVCQDCGKTVHSPIKMQHKEAVQYGPSIQALGLSLLDLGFVSVNRSKSLMRGFLSNDSLFSDGYICTLQKKGATLLKDFTEGLRLECVRSKVLHWDDTVIFINKKRGCMRFYGNDHFTLYVAHEKKDREGIDDDRVLAALGHDTVVVHDHVIMNYNADFQFQNAECVQHLIRELQKVADISHHTWPEKMKELISSSIHKRNELVQAQGSSFDQETIRSIHQKFDDILKLADDEFKESKGKYYENDERKLIVRLRKYKDNYLHWTKDFNVPPTNNLAERGLRSQKVKLKVSGQYQTVKSACYFAAIRSYTETCIRNGFDAFEALTRLAACRPYTLDEILGRA